MSCLLYTSFIAFITCGDPDLETTARAVRAAAENGADLIELGIPFSDPTAEGSVIQGANLRALNGGITTDKIFAFVKELRKDVTAVSYTHLDIRQYVRHLVQPLLTQKNGCMENNRMSNLT